MDKVDAEELFIRLTDRLASERASGNWECIVRDVVDHNDEELLRTHPAAIEEYCRALIKLPDPKPDDLYAVATGLLLLINTPESRRIIVDMIAPGYSNPAGAIFHFKGDGAEELCYGLTRSDPVTSRKCAHALLRLGRERVQECLNRLEGRTQELDPAAYGLLTDFVAMGKGK
jgi:hypothetical protein